MDVYMLLFVICIIHGSLYFFDLFLKSCSHYPYLCFLENTGLKIGLFKIHWYTTVFNNYFHKSVRWKPKFWRRWFSLGVWVTALSLPLAMFLVVRTAFSSIFHNEHSSASGRLVLEPMIPGVNLPLSDLSYYVTTIVISSIVHEAGHAIAAVRFHTKLKIHLHLHKEGVPVSGFGMCILVLLPSAYVMLNSNQLEALPPHRSLRILTAGVWHNIVLSAVAILAVFLLPWAISPMFSQEKGLYITDLAENSPFRGITGLHPGEVITKVNGNCPVRNREDWKNCILDAISEVEVTSGYCISPLLLYRDTSAVEFDSSDCCSKADEAGNLCFMISSNNDAEENEAEDQKLMRKNICLPARRVVEDSGIPCKTYFSCPNNSPICALPLVSNHTSLFIIERESRDKLMPKSMIFLGHPSEAWFHVKVSEFIPGFHIIPISAAVLPETILHLLKYLTVLSLGLALINVLPLFMFDGQYIIAAILGYFLESYVSRSVSNKISKYVIVTGSVTLGACLVIILLNV
ncbi:hypothetical protein J437_LFUL002083 [Ladona fulva]|uniref:Membrane-bound transcription factor site-2 protease n=1 Tax=Ladona fulva TaxID=123851 RepID=A0A8K0K0D3_LADFU|nr:hypothetical protein J437_LFUL002083 [Ladona fulva]